MLLSYKTCCIIEFKLVDIAFIQFWLTWGSSLLEDFYLFSEPLWIHLTIRSQSIFQLICINNPSNCLPSPYNSPEPADSLDVIRTFNPLYMLGQIQCHIGENSIWLLHTTAIIPNMMLERSKQVFEACLYRVATLYWQISAFYLS